MFTSCHVNLKLIMVSESTLTVVIFSQVQGQWLVHSQMWLFQICCLFMTHIDSTASLLKLTSASPGAPRVSTAKLKLPFNLVVKPVFPVKVAVHKLTIDTNKPPVNLNELFPGESSELLDFLLFTHLCLLLTFCITDEMIFYQQCCPFIVLHP